MVPAPCAAFAPSEKRCFLRRWSWTSARRLFPRFQTLSSGASQRQCAPRESVRARPAAFVPRVAALSQSFRRRRAVRHGAHQVAIESVFGLASGILALRIFAFSLPQAVDGVVRGDAIDPGAKVGAWVY